MGKIKDRTILFGDIKGFTKLDDHQMERYLAEISEPVAEKLKTAEWANTWGDGLMAVFESQTYAIDSALAIRDFFRDTRWVQKGFPSLKVRLALHAGEVFVDENRITKREDVIGSTVNLAARIEPIVEPNHVYATQAFVRRCVDVRTNKFHEIGEVALAKNWGDEHISVLAREHETIDSAALHISTSRDFPDVSVIGNISKSFNFGRRLEVSATAKRNIARFCVKNSFWRESEIVFLESGTLPVFMMVEMYRGLAPERRPRHIITNNVVCSLISTMGGAEADPSYAVFPDERATESTLIGGRIIEDYAATILVKFIEATNTAGFVAEEDLVTQLKDARVNHVIMMASKLTPRDGPCAVEVPMRRFKRALLRYAADEPGVRLSILAEADKLIGRRGEAPDTVYEADPETRYWDRVLEGGRTTLVCGLSPELTPAEIGFAKRQMQAIRDAGAECTLLSVVGDVIRLDEA